MIPFTLNGDYTAVVLGDGLFALKTMEFLNEIGVSLKLFIPRSSGADQEIIDFCTKNAIRLENYARVDTDEIFEALRNIEPDFLICASFDKILPKRLIELPKVAALNIHAAPLPFYRGGSPLNWQLIAGENHIVLTIHYMKVKVDSGNILSQIYIPVSKEDNYASIIQKTATAVPEAMLVAIAKAISGDLGTPLDTKEGFYLPRRKPGDEFIDWNWQARTIFNFVRALSDPGPRASTYYGDKILSFGSASIVSPEPFVGIPGTILARNKSEGSIVVKCGDSAVKLSYIRPQKLFEQLKVGDRLGVNMNMIWKELLKLRNTAEHDTSSEKE